MNWNRGRIPLLSGGVAARLQEMVPFLDWRSRGWFLSDTNHPGRSLGSRPPLLGKEGNAPTIPIHSQLHSPYSYESTSSIVGAVYDHPLFFRNPPHPNPTAACDTR